MYFFLPSLALVLIVEKVSCCEKNNVVVKIISRLAPSEERVKAP